VYHVTEMPSFPRWVVASGSILAAVLCGCGLNTPKRPASARTVPSASSTTKQSAPHYDYLTQAEVGKRAATSPGRAVLDFWWDVQNEDFYRAYALLAKSFQHRSGRGVQEFGVLLMDDYTHWLGKGPRLILENISGSSATVVTEYAPPGLPSLTPVSFSLVREAGQWKIAYNFYLTVRLSA
jgi:hypothetical protein